MKRLALLLLGQESIDPHAPMDQATLIPANKRCHANAPVPVTAGTGFPINVMATFLNPFETGPVIGTSVGDQILDVPGRLEPGHDDAPMNLGGFP